MSANATRWVRALFLGIPCSFVGLWEYRVYAEKREIKALEARFVGGTPFYGKRWGYTTDFMIHQSLQTGDLVFISYKLENRHLSDVVWDRLNRYLSRHNWDDCYMVVHRESDKYLVQLAPTGGLTLKPYAELLATSSPMLVSVRRLQAASETLRCQLYDTVNQYLQQTDNAPWRLSRLSSVACCYYRFTSPTNPAFEWCSNMIDLNRNINILRVYEQRLGSALEDMARYFRLSNRQQSSNDEELHATVQGLLEEYRASVRGLEQLVEAANYKTTYRNPRPSSPTDGLKTPEESAGGEVQQTSASHKTELPILSSLFGFISSCLEMLLSALPEQTRALSLIPVWSHNYVIKVYNYLNNQKACLQKMPLSSASLVALLYQRVGLLPQRPQPELWNPSDFFGLDALMNPEDTRPDKAGNNAAGPSLSPMFYVRDDGPEHHAKWMAKLRRRTHHA